uniref:Uncharacterized protein n=1 Tax=Anguilla anguilla TaxID=7936 RepID=A0A0E9V337_ANGAN
MGFKMEHEFSKKTAASIWHTTPKANGNKNTLDRKIFIESIQIPEQCLCLLYHAHRATKKDQVIETFTKGNKCQFLTSS